MENTLYQIFTSDYDRTSFEDNVLKPIFKDSAQKFVLYDKDGEQEISLTETDLRTAKKVVKYGEFITHDDRKVDLYEITIEDFNKIKIARVGLGALVKKLIIGNNAVFAIFRYEDTKDKHWRFSFIAYDSFFQDGQVQTTETSPKRYTYVFGDEHETYRTATDRFLELESKNKIKVKDIQDAFAVEAMSKEFFDEYRETHYAKFVKYLTGDEFVKKGGKYELIPIQNPSPFLASVFNGDKVVARDFCKKLLGQIVFLYFLQKKGWMGSSTGNYKSADGDKNFLQNFFIQTGANDVFYTIGLTKLFYDTLNKERENDDFEMPDKSIVKIPYLNGGLFDKESEKHDFLTFPKELFADLFEFFNRFNFTIYENSPEEHTVAVDPEMLGHIFENLLEDNKDKGTFYTPKEIVHYMTQESLIEYLVTHLGENTKEGIYLFVKQKDKEQLSDEQLNEINNLLDRVKICDPAIGSGAFPMGLLQEIFTLKERIAFDLGYSVWSPATVKENIIQNSIYGVDIEKGAVDIAQLRFWLSLIVDADVPKALPNLAYKIVVGNSLVSKFEDEVIEIDWSTDSAKGGLFAQELIEKKINLLRQISEKQKLYFKAKGQKKEKLAKEIRTLKLDILSTELKVMIETKGTTLDGNAKPTKKQMDGFLQTEGWRKTLTKIEHLKNNDQPFSHFDWALDFPELLNPLIVEEKDNRGFDIIIGNPPYIKEYTNKAAFDGFRNSPYYQGKMDIWYGFACVCIDLLKKNGAECFIAQNNWITSAGASVFRNKVLSDTEIKLFTDFWDYKVFKSAGIQTMIYLLKRKESETEYEIKYSLLKDNTVQESELPYFLDFESKQYYSEKYILNFKKDLYEDSMITFNNPLIDNIINKILENSFETLKDTEVAQGIVFPQDKLNQKNADILEGDVCVNDGIFQLTKNEVDSLSLSEQEYELIKPFYSTKELHKYYGNSKNTEWIIYTKSDIKNQIVSYPNIKTHLDKYAEIITSDNKPYGLHRARKEDFFVGEKIISVRKNFEPSFTYTDFDCYVTQTFYSIKSDRFDLKFLTTLLNSKLIAFWLRYKGKMQGNNYQIDKEPLVEIPIVQPDNIRIFVQLFDIINFLYSKNTEVNELVKNEIIAKYFEEVIDGCVFDLYFTDYMRTKNLDITQLVEKEITKITDLSDFSTMDDKLKSEIIWKLYEILSHPDHPVKNRILKFPISSPDILKPILEN
ncbi:Eco57I restriction-modification methylase domain-containing protein [Flavobacterium microcysteis]